MQPSSSPKPVQDTRLGFHYFPDTLHYRETDLQTWLPVLQNAGASWLVLRSELDRAIPEPFLRGLKQASIEPVIHFHLPLDRMPDLVEIGTLLEVYARWGARYLIFFDRPNEKAVWPASSWVQQDLVERFLDRFLPLANLSLQLGLIPVFPPLQPGGSYWDTAFLRSALQAMQRRKQDPLLQGLVLSAYAWTGGHSLDWGSGGPERWPLARPYQRPENTQDQCGFRIFDWYLAVARSVLHQACPIILLQAGLSGDPAEWEPDREAPAAQGTTAGEGAGSRDARQIEDETGVCIARLLAGEQVTDPANPANLLEPVPPQVIAANFWVLGAAAKDPHSGQAWFDGEGVPRDPARRLLNWRREWLARQAEQAAAKLAQQNNGRKAPVHPIRHYLLLPGFEWGVSDWYLEVIRPFVKKHRPTIGFSPAEAEQAAWVTVVGNAQNYPEDMLERLQNAGCRVEQINGDGTNIATLLAER